VADAATSELPVHLRDGAIAIDGRPIVRGVDFDVSRGEFVTIMGPNGSGKSTLMRGLVGLLPIVKGEFELFGTPFGSYRDWHRIGYVPQRVGIVGGVPATVREVVTSGRLTRRKLLRPLTRADRVAIDEALEIVGLADLSRARLAHLSGGQQQRVLIARALAGQPELLFLDEPTAGVDLPNQLALAATLGTLKERGSTIVMVVHELGPIAELVDRAVVLRDGLVTYDGPRLSQNQAHAHLDHLAEHGRHPVEDRPAPDHVPQIASPIDTIGGGA
jgi:zinc transport system ATP-binding protein